VTFLLTELAENQKFALYATTGPAAATVRIWPDAGSAQFPPESHLMLLLDGQDGHLLALIAGDEINLLRTSVPVGVGAKHLARPRSEVYALIGSGEQAGGHVRVVAHGVPGLKQIRVYSRTPANRERFAKEWNEKVPVEVVAVDSAEAAVRGEAPAREHDDQTVCYSVAAPWSWDGPIMQWVYEWAKAHGAGTEIALAD
jgi:ornithine cyclodeaminase/alanine dehydrogenase-like protein (mu-crystallin family)